MPARRREKVTSAIVFLDAAQDPAAARALAMIGFDEAEQEHGYALLRALTEGTMSRAEALPEYVDPLEALNQFEDHWFPLLDACLRYRHSDVHAFLFGGIKRGQGHEALLSVTMLLERFARLPGENLTGTQAAMDRLARQGFGQEQLDGARQHWDALKLDPKAPNDHSAHRQRLADAEDTLWDWLREWRSLARHSITDARVRRRLGIANPRQASARRQSEGSPVDDAKAGGE